MCLFILHGFRLFRFFRRFLLWCCLRSFSGLTGSYLSSTAGITLGDPMAYLVAPPLEATYGIDAALKSADVQLATYVPPPSETNYSAAFLTGSQAACKAACNAFTDAVLEIARNPIQRA